MIYMHLVMNYTICSSSKWLQKEKQTLNRCRKTWEKGELTDLETSNGRIRLEFHLKYIVWNISNSRLTGSWFPPICSFCLESVFKQLIGFSYSILSILSLRLNNQSKTSLPQIFFRFFLFPKITSANDNRVILKAFW